MDTCNVTYHSTAWAAALTLASAAAKKSIHLSALSLLPPTPNATGTWPELWRTWCAAAQRGVTVDLWLPTPCHAHPATRANFRAGEACAKNGIKIHYVNPSKLLHAKTAVVDEQIAWIGSGNFTAAAAHHNHEAYIEVHSAKIAREIISRWKLLS